MRTLICIMFSLLISQPALAQPELTRYTIPDVGQTVAVTPGQQFYSDFTSKPVLGFRLEHPFKSSMAGAMGLPFTFAIDGVLLVPAGTSKNGEWTYYIPADNKFRASHWLLGSVIREGDSVGLRVHSSGRREWFVDNSKYNGMTTIWSRRLKEGDPKLTRVQTNKVEPSGLPINKLFFLGVSDEEVRIRSETIDPSGTVRDEFTYPVNSNGEAIVQVKGAEFKLQISGSKARITLVKPMTSEFGSLIPSSE